MDGTDDKPASTSSGAPDGGSFGQPPRPPAGAAPRASAAAMSGAAPGREIPDLESADGAASLAGHHADVAQARQELEAIRRHHGSTGRSGSLRAAIFGINDGLVSNFSLVLGMAGADLNTQVVILAGVAGLVAGAFSMAAGEYVSM